MLNFCQEEAKQHTRKRSTRVCILIKLVEARKLLENKCEVDNQTVCISLLNTETKKLYLAKMSKSDFLTQHHSESFTFDEDIVKLTIDHPNYVNTKLSTDNPKYVPLTVKYPIVKNDKLKEMAYYTPAHKVLQEAVLAKLGSEYLEQTIEKAATSLRKSKLEIPEKVISLAKLLCIVEHIDHKRFMTEPAESLFKEVEVLYALNQNNTYRYSVSRAGAGGMVQMIPSTYKEVRNAFPQISLIADFEEAMTDHHNAAKAMLLYLKRYHSFFLEKEQVIEAIKNGIATEEELMAAGYNSNPVNVPRRLSYGKYWKYYLPKETKVYLSILHALDSSITTGDINAPTEVVAVYRPKSSTRSSKKIASVRAKKSSQLRHKTVTRSAKKRSAKVAASRKNSPSRKLTVKQLRRKR